MKFGDIRESYKRRAILKNKQIAIVSLSLIFIGLNPVTLKSQAPVKPIKTKNSIQRIDSLTKQYYTQIPSHTKPKSSFISNYSEYSPSHFNANMKKLGSSIPFEVNSQVERYIKYYLSLKPEFYDILHERMQTYFPVFEEILDGQNLPLELKYVSVIESNLNPNAVSWCGATGLWQFMPYTGKNMGMRINYSLDERKSILKSTQTACTYFQNSQGLFDDWLMSIASYNCGAGNVQKAIRRSGLEDPDFWEIVRFLPKETQNYIPKFIAVTYILNFTVHAERLNYNKESEFLVYTNVDTALHFEKVCKYLQPESEKELTKLNCELLKPNTANATNNCIILPYDNSMQFFRDQDTLIAHYGLSKNELVQYSSYSSNRSSGRAQYHRIRSGETLSGIARKYRTSVKRIMRLNGMRSTFIRAGKSIRVR